MYGIDLGSREDYVGRRGMYVRFGVARPMATPSALAVSARGRRSHRYRGQHAADTAAEREPCMERSM